MRFLKNILKKERGMSELLTGVIALMIMIGIVTGICFAIGGGLRGLTGSTVTVIKCGDPGFVNNNPGVCN